MHRFDHHRNPPQAPDRDPVRRVLYASFTLSGCVVEVFGDTGVIDPGSRRIALLRPIRDLLLVDLRGGGAMRAGSVAALAKVADRDLSQQWSRYFYENAHLYGAVEGILYSNAHNDEDALLLYERARGASRLAPAGSMRLDHPTLRPALQQIALDHNLMPPA